MTITKGKNLLPIGAKLDHDGQPLKIDKLLGAGLTAEVYKGTLRAEEREIPVAIKAMKTLEFPMARQLFLQESETLAFLMHLEEEADREQGVNLKVAPHYYGRGEINKTPFMVMEFIEGQKILDLLRDSQEGKFPEPQALVIAWHLFRTLDILHRRLHKTYIDLKFENLWWSESITEWGGQLKITDFGTLEDIQPTDSQNRAVRRDLLLASAYLCKMLTGFMPDYSLGVLRKAVEPEIKNKPMSWGSARLLRQLLHSNPERRPASAAQVSIDLRTLVDFWFKPIEKVLDAARRAMERAERAYEEADKRDQPLGDQGLADAIRARSAFDIARLRSPDLDLAQEIERVEGILRISGYLERGKALLRGRSYSLAKQVFEEGIDWSEEPAVLRRWSYLAQVGEEVSLTVFETEQENAFEALEALNQRKWKEAASRLDLLKQALPSKGIDYLLAECALFAEIDHAEEAAALGNYEQAATHYRQAEHELSKLPSRYADFIRKHESGNLGNLAYEMEAHLGECEAHEKAKRSIAAAREAIEKGEKDKAIDSAKNSITIYRPFGFLSKQLLELVHAALSKRYYSMATQLAQIGILYGDKSDAISFAFILAEHLYQADKSLENGDVQGFDSHIRYIWDSYRDDLAAQSGLKDLLERAEQKARSTKNTYLYDVIADLAAQFSDLERAKRAKGESERLKASNIEQRHTLVDSLLTEAQYWLIGLSSSRPEMLATVLGEMEKLASPIADLAALARSKKERIEKVGKILAYAKTLSDADEYRHGDVKGCQEWWEQTKQQLDAAAEAAEEQARQQYENNLFYLNQRWQDLEGLVNWAKRGWEVKAESQAQRLIQQQIGQELSEFLLQCYMALHGERLQSEAALTKPDDTEGFEDTSNARGALEVLIEKAQRVLNILTPSALESALQIEQTLQAASNKFEDVKTAFQGGDLAKASQILDQLATQEKGAEWHDWHAKILRAEAWQGWLQANSNAFTASPPQYNPVLLKAIRAYLSSGLPKAYWSKNVEDYLKNLLEAARQHAKEAIKAKADRPETLEAIKEWLNISWTLSAVSFTDQRLQAVWDQEAWLREAYRLLRQRDMTALAKHINEVAIPENVEASLSGLTIENWERISREEEEKLKREQKQKATRRLVARIAATMSVICLLSASLLWFNRYAAYQALFGTYTPTVTTSPTFTLTPSPIPSPTLAPSPTITPTPIPPSVYLLADPTGLYPALPIDFEKVWVIPPESVKPAEELEKKPWKKETSADPQEKSESFYSTQGPVAINWIMDQPLEGGFYEVFVLDTKTKSGGYGIQPYTVWLNEQPVSPYRGQSNVIFNTDEIGKQKNDTWISLGVYEVRDGQRIQIRTDVQQLSDDKFFALSRLLIARLSSRQKELYDKLPGGRVLYGSADDRQAVIFTEQEVLIKKVKTKTDVSIDDKYQGQLLFDPNIRAWGGSYRYLSLDELKGISDKIKVRWSLAGRIPAGKYQLLVWIPAQHATAIGQFTLLLDEKPVTVPNPSIINQGDHSDEWWDLGIWDVTQESAVTVQFAVDRLTNLGKELGIDAVALVKVEQ